MKTNRRHFVAFVGMLMLAVLNVSLLGEDAFKIVLATTNPTTQQLKVVQYDTNGKNLGDFVTIGNVGNPIEFALRDITYHKKNLYCIVGTFKPQILRMSPEKTQMFDYPGWSFINAAHYGALTSYKDHIYTADMWTAQGNDTGLIRFTFNHQRQQQEVARFVDSASISDVTATNSGHLVIVDEFGRLMHMDPETPDNAARIRVVDPEPLGHMRGNQYHVTCATALDDGTMIFGTLQKHVVVERPLGAAEVHVFDSVISDVDTIGATRNVVVCDTTSGTFSILDTKFGNRITVRFAGPNDRATAFSCVFAMSEDSDFMGPPAPKPIPPAKPKAKPNKQHEGAVTVR